MTERRSKQISSRKQPQQARSAELVSAILTAAIQVLAQEGAARFTTARVAERAGVSVGSLYQYFPNKAAILFRLQSEEWRQTTDMLSRILVNREKTPVERLRLLVQAFIRSECEEAQMRVALNDAAPLYRDAPEALAVKATGKDIVQVFMREALPDVPPVARRLAGDRRHVGSGGQAILRNAANRYRDRVLCRCDGGHVLRVFSRFKRACGAVRFFVTLSPTARSAYTRWRQTASTSCRSQR